MSDIYSSDNMMDGQGFPTERAYDIYVVEGITKNRWNDYAMVMYRNCLGAITSDRMDSTLITTVGGFIHK